MAESELYRRGSALRRELMGEEMHAQLDNTVYADPAGRQFRDLSIELLFGGIWSRPGLDLKTRSLVCVISDAATGAPELELHLRIAMRQGWTEQEMVEVFLQLMGYVGAPLARQAFIIAQRVFPEFRTAAQS